MARTIQALLTEARGYIQDTKTPFRNSDADLVTYLNDSIFEVRRIRPDAFVGMYDTAVPQFTIADLGSDYPLDGIFFTATAYFIAGSTGLRDDEHVVDSRAQGLLALFSAKLTQPGA